MGPIRFLVLFLRGTLRDQTELAVENLALRQQLAILQQKSKTPRLRKHDRISWVWLPRIWTSCEASYFDGNGAVDLYDFAYFQRVFASP